jgi:diketogulonate reductase-like aldo/keto reductase
VHDATTAMRMSLTPRALSCAAKDSLARLPLFEVDLLLLHWPNPRVPLSETLEALCKVKRSGLARHIGGSNFAVGDIQEAVRHVSEPLVCNQVEMNSSCDRPTLTAVSRAHGMAVMSSISSAARRRAQLDATVSPLRNFANKTLPGPAYAVLRDGYRLIRQIIFDHWQR